MTATAAVRRLTAAVEGRTNWLFDLDGTLVDSSAVHDSAFRAALAELAPQHLATFRYHPGASSRDVIGALCPDPDTAARMVACKQEHYRRAVEAGQVGVLPGALRLLDLLAAQGCSTYLVTNGSRGSVDRVLGASALRHRFRGVLTADDVSRNKPDPAIYREACRRWRLDPDTVLVVEDSRAGVAAAVGAGLRTLWLHGHRRGHRGRRRPDRQTPAAALTEVADLISRAWAGTDE